MLWLPLHPLLPIKEQKFGHHTFGLAWLWGLWLPAGGRLAAPVVKRHCKVSTLSRGTQCDDFDVHTEVCLCYVCVCVCVCVSAEELLRSTPINGRICAWVQRTCYGTHLLMCVCVFECKRFSTVQICYMLGKKMRRHLGKFKTLTIKKRTWATEI